MKCDGMRQTPDGMDARWDVTGWDESRKDRQRRIFKWLCRFLRQESKFCFELFLQGNMFSQSLIFNPDIQNGVMNKKHV